ncbi:MAG: glutamate racemase [Coriobacteriaceae bacterium]|nr:glutamate racemase [Coriobacteriaceae bacterium]
MQDTNEKHSGSSRDISSLPIGVFDSGVGGLTVAREIANKLPHESISYFGDTLRCPYGPRPLTEVRTFARQISAWLTEQRIKLLVIGCNSATAAGLETVQRELDVPVIGVIEPGARAAVKATAARRVGVIGTVATIDSGAYTKAIRSLDAGITVFSSATPRFVEMVEEGLRLDHNPFEDIMAQASAIYIRPAFQEIARDYLNPLKRCQIDTLVLGCTHFPLLTPLISSIIGSEIGIISSAEETARDVAETLARRGQAAPDNSNPIYRFATTASDLGEFSALGSMVFGRPIKDAQRVSIEQLEKALQDKEN